MTRSRDLISQYNKGAATDIFQRNNAENILSPGDVAGEYNAAIRGLTTTVDGIQRAITYEDLKKFKSSMSTLKGKLTKAGFKGGVSAKTVISSSLKVDLDRAHKDITIAAPIRKDGTGLVTFKTNASAESNVNHHIVHVRFMDFGAALAAKKVDAALIRSMAAGRIKFDCDCGRHRFWYRFIATTGGFNEGRAETGYPKIRNPNLKGIGCKHVLRVMTQITKSPSFKAFAKQWIELYRIDASPKHKDVKVADIDAFEKSAKLESWRQRSVTAGGKKKSGASPMDLARKLAAKAKADGIKAKTAQINSLNLLLDAGVLPRAEYNKAMKKVENA